MKLRTELFLLVLTLLTPLLLWLAWPPLPFVFFVFVAFIPIFLLSDLQQNELITKKKFYLYIYLSFFLWNGAVTHWIYEVTILDGLLVNIANPIIMLIPVILSQQMKRHLTKITSYVFFVALWLVIEYLHFNWELSYPFLTLGYSLSKYPILIQWFEYTGVLGGSLWILSCNIFLYEAGKNIFGMKGIFVSKIVKYALPPFLILVFPVSISVCIFNLYEEKGKTINVIAVHPNIDCYNEKYLWVTEKLVAKYLDLSLKGIDSTTDYVIWPETAITEAGLIDDISNNPDIIRIREATSKFPNLKIISGLILYELYKGEYKPSMKNPYLRYSKPDNLWYYTYNAALQIDKGDIYIRTKQKLVPFEETIPYPNQLNFLASYIKSMGDFNFSVRNKNNNTFYDSNKTIKSSAIICYESIFGSFNTRFVKKGANILFILLNEGWYNNQTGAAQFMYYASARAIETRRPIARSSNRGISCLINQKGELLNIMKESKPGFIKGVLISNDKLTAYVEYGDYVGKLSIAISLILLGSIYFKKKFVKNTLKSNK